MMKQLRRGVDWFLGKRKPTEERVATFVLRIGDLPVGELKLVGGEWRFAYSEEFKAQTKISPLVDFPNVEKQYRDRDLWPFFMLRIPSPEQAMVKEFIKEKGTSEVDEATLLKEFGRKSVANPFELTTADA